MSTTVAIPVSATAQSIVENYDERMDQLQGALARALAGPAAKMTDPAHVRAALAERDLALVALCETCIEILAYGREQALRQAS